MAPILGLAVAAFGACGKSSTGDASAVDGATTTAFRPLELASKRVGQGDVSLAGMTRQLDLLQSLHLAEIDQSGLWIELGTPARLKHTFGDWKTGWGKTGKLEGVAISNVEMAGRLFFDWDRPEALTFRFHMQPRGNVAMMVFLNNRPLPGVKFDHPERLSYYDVQVPAELVLPGENQLLLRFDKAIDVAGARVAAAVASVRVTSAAMGVAASPATGQVAAGAPAVGAMKPFSSAALRRSVKLHGDERDAVSLSLPSTLRYHLQVPVEGRLFIGVGVGGADRHAVRARVSVRSEDGAAAELLSTVVAGKWQEHVVDLRRFAGKLVRLELRADRESGGTGSVTSGRSPAGQQPTAAAAQVAWSNLGLWTKTAAARPELRRPKHVVVLLVDTLRADKLRPFRKDSRVKTPALDLIASEGTVFASAQAPENYTKPSVASVLTGLYPVTHNVKAHEARLADSAVMLSEHFKGEGYQTGGFVANGYVSDRFGFQQGWDSFVNYVREVKSVKAEHVFADAAKWMEQHRNQPMFVYVHTVDPHVPYQPPDAFLQLYDRQPYEGPVPRSVPAEFQIKASAKPPKVVLNARDRDRLASLYDGTISYHDFHMGKFIDKLKALGLWDDTVFVFTSDHGEEFGEHGGYGHGHTLYQELLNVPLLFRHPGSVPAGKRIDSVVGTVDIASTLVELTRTKPLVDAEGHSLVGMMYGETLEVPNAAFSDFLDHRRAMRVGDWKYELHGTRPTLFNLTKDPKEQQPLPLGKFAVAARFCRATYGQFLGAADRRDWLSASGRSAVKQLKADKANIDPTLQNQLKQLGYGN